MSLQDFRKKLQSPDIIQTLQNGVIGDGITIPGLFENVKLTYADYVASGRALAVVEDYIRDAVLPYYANSHTEASFCGSFMTRLRAEARSEIARLTNADAGCSVIFNGSGATAGLNRLVKLFGVNEARKAVVFIGPYEHHSNILPWRESDAEVVEIPEAKDGGLDMAALETALQDHADADVKIGSFSAASNVTGIMTQPDDVTRLLKRHGALSIWDFAGGAPYMPIDMNPSPDCAKDAVVVSPHKFAGGPGGSGVLIVRNAAVVCNAPTAPGGGTVTFVSPSEHHYSEALTTREEAGTPNVIGDIRAALAFLVKEAMGDEFIATRQDHLNQMALDALGANPQITLLGVDYPDRLPIFSFVVRRKDDQRFHHQLFTRMLSDIYGIQVRGGCACAGPYAHRLLHIEDSESHALFDRLRAGEELAKPGWVRLNFSPLMSDEKARFILDSINDLTHRMEDLEQYYRVDPATARFTVDPAKAA